MFFKPIYRLCKTTAFWALKGPRVCRTRTQDPRPIRNSINPSGSLIVWSPLDLVTCLPLVRSAYQIQSFWPLWLSKIELIWAVWSFDQIITTVRFDYLLIFSICKHEKIPKKSQKISINSKLIQSRYFTVLFIYSNIYIIFIICLNISYY